MKLYYQAENSRGKDVVSIKKDCILFEKKYPVVEIKEDVILTMLTFLMEQNCDKRLYKKPRGYYELKNK